MSTMDQWTAAVCADLGLDPSSADLRAVLDLTRDVAHGVARPAAPLTAYLVGVAVGRGLALRTRPGGSRRSRPLGEGRAVRYRTVLADALATAAGPAAGYRTLTDPAIARRAPACLP